jgi:hypothetical protein
MSTHAFIVRPFGTRNGIDFGLVQRTLIEPAFERLGITGDTTEAIARAGKSAREGRQGPVRVRCGVGPSGGHCPATRLDGRERTAQHLDSATILPDGVVGTPGVPEGQIPQVGIVKPRGDIQSFLTSAMA